MFDTSNETIWSSVSALTGGEVWAAGVADNLAQNTGQLIVGHRTSSGTWTTEALDVSSPTGFAEIHAISSNDVWVTLQLKGAIYTYGVPAMLHYDGSSWQSVSLPAPPFDNAVLKSIAGTSSSDQWAVGSTRSTSSVEPLIEHWDGQSWAIADTSGLDGTLNGALSGVSVLSGTDVWVAGGDAGNALVGHWNGTLWTATTIGSGYFYSISAFAPDDVWAVGTRERVVDPNDPYNGHRADGLVAHWDGVTWTEVPTPFTGLTANDVAAEFKSVDGTSTTDVWALAVKYTYINQSIYHQLVPEHWDGSSWTTIGGLEAGGTGELSVGTDQQKDQVWELAEVGTAIHACSGPIWGDVNCSRGFGSDDTVALLRYLGGTMPASTQSSCPGIGTPVDPNGDLQGDLNCDGIVDARDVLRSLYALGGLYVPSCAGGSPTPSSTPPPPAAYRAVAPLASTTI